MISKLSKILFALPFFCSVSDALCGPVLWNVSEGGNGHLYHTVYVTNGITWTDAKAAAIASGGYLCTITSPEENDFVANLAHGDPRLWMNIGDTISGPWLGGFQPDGSPEPDGGWTWLTGETWMFTAWYSGEPNDTFGIEKKLQFYGGLDINSITTWNDVSDSSSIQGYIVEFEPEVIKSSIRVSEVEISWPSLTNVSYRVEYRQNLKSGDWLTLTNANCVKGNGNVLSVYDKITNGQPQRFFRVMPGGTNCVE